MDKYDILKAAFIALVEREDGEVKAEFGLLESEANEWWNKLVYDTYYLSLSYHRGIAGPCLRVRY